ncbi:hypothetical protein K9O30_14035 [Clostridium bowmanii]|uniref:hypothetical protein n=1 Tax=Clostridium bowmanii TaxID=132925 RepID=UPI001C0B3BB7|nr:hypothetical protein [Clostridium bowmanii]MBU3190206.1 hypothetical protein [Clostridium bowmanii]MCA1074819.1 hypothetical protein [Clostridium bowmanii]
MICNSCKNEFTNIDGLKFCPYCGWEIQDNIDLEAEQIPDKINNEQRENIVDAGTVGKKSDTLAMPAITEEDINKFNKGKFFSSLKKPFVNIKGSREKFFTSFKKPVMNLKVLIPIIALLVVIAGGVFAYSLLIVKPVDEVRIKADLIGKVITLPKGTSIKISEDYMKSFTISSRNTDKHKDEIKVALTLNNGAIEAKTLVSIVYTSEGNNQWKVSDEIGLEGVTAIKPVVGMDEKKFLTGLKKLNINISDTPVTLGGQDVKKLGISSRTPDLKNGKEEIIVQASIDSGLLAANGKIKCKLVFENEIWTLASIVENSNEDFKLIISPTFSNEKVIEPIKKRGFEETLSYSGFFGGKGFTVKDSFTNSIVVSGKEFDAQTGTLNVTAKRENAAGELNLGLSTYYTFSISLSKISLIDGSKTTIDSGKINNVPDSVIKSTISNGEIEGSNLLFWWSNNHKITPEELNTYKTKETLSKKGFENIKYVYGSITYLDVKKDKKDKTDKVDKTVSFVAVYFLVYDDAKGYNWKLDKLVGEDSPNYKDYSKISENQ